MVGEATALSCAFHANISLLDQPGRTLVRRAHPEKAAAWRPHLDQPARGRHPLLHRAAQREPQTLQVDQIRRRDPLGRQALLPESRADVMWRILDSRD